MSTEPLWSGMWHSSADRSKFASPLGGVVGLCRKDILFALMDSGCGHITLKIISYLDSQSLLACSLVCSSWQKLLLDSVYSTPKFRNRVQAAIVSGSPTPRKLRVSLDLARSAIVDVALDDDLNLFALAAIAGRPQVMSCSLFTHGRRRWVHRFMEQFKPPSQTLTCIAAGQSLVTLGSKDGRIHVYEASQEYKCLRLTAILAHHKQAIHKIHFTANNHIVSCSDDMTIGVVAILKDGSLLLAKLLHGHVSRVRAIDVQKNHLLSGSDDRSVKLWGLTSTTTSDSCDDRRPLTTMTGHSGPVTAVQLSFPLAVSAAGFTVRLWDALQGTCLKLLEHDDGHPVTAMTWLSTFRAVATVDCAGTFRCFVLDQLETTKQEILKPDSTFPFPENSCSTSGTKYSPKQSSKFFSSRDPKLLSSWPDDVILKLESIPHHILAFSINNSLLPSLTIHCLDYVP